MIGAIIGDIVGSVYEFDQIKTKDFVFFEDYHKQKCEFTDDPVTAIDAVKALLKADGAAWKLILQTTLKRY